MPNVVIFYKRRALSTGIIHLEDYKLIKGLLPESRIARKTIERYEMPAIKSSNVIALAA